MPFAAALPSIVSGIGGIAGGLLGGSEDSPARFPQFNAGGLKVNTGQEGKFNIFSNVSSSPFRRGLVEQRAQAFSDLAGELGGLRGGFTPGEGLLSRGVSGRFDVARERALGNLRQNLARRRVAGSSFAADAASRLEAEFALRRDEALRSAFLEELDVSTRLLGQEFTARSASIQSQLDELNLQADLVRGIMGSTQSALTSSLNTSSLLAAQVAQGRAAAFTFGAGQLAEAAKTILE